MRQQWPRRKENVKNIFKRGNILLVPASLALIIVISFLQANCIATLEADTDPDQIYTY